MGLWPAFYFTRYKVVAIGTQYMEFVQRVEGIITPSIEELGFRIVQINFIEGKPPRLQVLAEHAETGRMNLDDCVNVSRRISVVLDVEDPLAGSYDLEVSSPGIDRPLITIKDYEKYSGFDVRIEMKSAIEGRKKITGRLRGVNEENVTIELEGKITDLKYKEIEKAKLLLNDELIAASEGLL